jgi:hypothetical protein
MAKKKLDAKDLSESLAINSEAEAPSAKRVRRSRTGKSSPTVGKTPPTNTPAQPGMPGSVNDSRRCTAKAHRTGERCKAPAMLGQTKCRVHGGASPQARKTAKERLLELADPALAALSKIVRDEEADDAVRLRASLGILDRIGLGPGVHVGIETGDRWSTLLDDATMVDNRTLGGGGEAAELTNEAALQLALDARDDAWREYDDADAAEYASRPSFRDENTISGTVVQSRYVGRPPQGPTDPPLYWPEDARRGDA